jgi:DNA-binding transcriptional regulator YdaS (Cro superfamily)
MQITNIEKALRIVGKSQMAKELGLTRAAVYSWSKKNKIPAQHILKVEELSGVSRYDLDPQIYGKRSVA